MLRIIYAFFHRIDRFLTPCLRSRDCNQPCHYLHGVCETHAIVYKLLHARSRELSIIVYEYNELLIHQFTLLSREWFCGHYFGIFLFYFSLCLFISFIITINNFFPRNSGLKNVCGYFATIRDVSLESMYFVMESLSAHLNSYISERSHKANNLSGDHTLVKIIAKLWDAYSFNYQPALPGQ